MTTLPGYPGEVSLLVLENRKSLAGTVLREVGKPITEARNEVAGVARNYENLAEEAKRIAGEMVPVDANPGSEKRLAFTLRVPVGVVCAIAPFNFPLSLATGKVGPAIAAGNTVILKPTQQTPVSACRLVDLFQQAGLPPEHIQLVQGPGSGVGEWLLENPGINFYSLTGSTRVGDHIIRSIGLRRCAMELGSNAAVIVHKDADVAKAAREIECGGVMINDAAYYKVGNMPYGGEKKRLWEGGGKIRDSGNDGGKGRCPESIKKSGILQYTLYTAIYITRRPP